MTPDSELVRRYADDRSDTAFSELVRRHLDLVYSSALRQLAGDELLAKDITQSVFLDLAKKAASLTDHTSLAGWLYASTRFAAQAATRSDSRRRARELEASAMQEQQSAPANEIDWNQLRPVLDDVMLALPDSDREAILLRFFQGRDLKTVGAALGVSDDAARKRVDRALDQLRDTLLKRGINSTSAALGAALAGTALVTAPSGFATVITGAVCGAAASATTATTTLMSLTKLKIGIATLTAMALTGVGTSVVVQRSANQRLETINAELSAQAAQLESLREENSRLGKIQTGENDLERLRSEHSELLKLRGEVALLRRETSPNPGRASLPPNGRSRADAELIASLVAQLQQRIVQPKEQDPTSICINNLRQLDGAKAQWALENRKVDTDRVTLFDIAPYLRNSVIPTCIAQGTYSVTTVAAPPICTIPGHTL